MSSSLRIRLAFLLAGLFSTAARAQDDKGLVIEDPSARLVIGGMHFPADLAGNVSNAAWLQVAIDDDLLASIEGFQNTYVLSERLRVEMLLKRGIGNGFLIFGGLEWERETGAMAPVGGYRYGGLLGLGYEPSRGVNLEAGWSRPFNATRIGSLGATGKGSGAVLKARIRY